MRVIANVGTAAELEAQRPNAASWQWMPVDLGPFLSGEPPDTSPTALRIDEEVSLFYPNRINLVMGESESLKTWLCCIAIAQEISAGRHVVVLDYEDTASSLVERLRALGVAPERIVDFLTYYDGPSPRLDELSEGLIAERITAMGSPSLVVLDGNTEAIAALGLNPDSGVDVAAFYAGVPRYFAGTGAAVVMVDHVTKDREGRGRWAIGSERKISGLDGAAYMVDLVQPFGRERTGKAKIVVSKDRQGHVRRYQNASRVIAVLELTSWPDGGITWNLSRPSPGDDGDVFRPTGIMERLSRAIEERPGLSKNGLRAAVPGRNELKDLALELLIAEGYVIPEPGPRGARLHVSARPFREASDASD